MMNTTELVQDLRDLIDLHPHAQVIVDQAIAQLEQQASAAVTDEQIQARAEVLIRDLFGCAIDHDLRNLQSEVERAATEIRALLSAQPPAPAVGDGELPPLPDHPLSGFWTHAEMQVIRAYGQECAGKATEEIKALHTKLAGETLRADQGWQRYEEANAARNRADTEIARKAIAAQPAAVQSGWKMVPVEPTQEMLNSGYYGHTRAEQYRRMLAAAPTPPVIGVPALVGHLLPVAMGGYISPQTRIDGAAYAFSGSKDVGSNWNPPAIPLYTTPPAAASVVADARDAERLDFVTGRQAFICATTTDAGTIAYQLMEQDEDEEFHILSGKDAFFPTHRAAIDAAIAAQAKEAK